MCTNTWFGTVKMNPESSQQCPVPGQESVGTIPTSHKENFSALRVIEPWSRLHREAVEPSSSEMLKSMGLVKPCLPRLALLCRDGWA